MLGKIGLCAAPESQSVTVDELVNTLKWAMAAGRLSYTRRIIGQNESYCDAIDRANDLIKRATGQ